MKPSPHEGRRLRQFIILVRHFRDRLNRDFFATGEGDVSNGVTTLLALLIAYGVCVAVFLILTFSFQVHRALPSERIEAVLSARDFLTAGTIALTGAYFVFLWENLFPDRIDCQILLAQPVSHRLVLAAKLCAALLFLGGFLVAMNIAPAIVLPFVALSAGGTSIVLEFLAHSLALSGAALTVFFGLTAILSVLHRVLPYAMFQVLKPALQFITFLLFLGQMFFTPPLTDLRTLLHHDLPQFAVLWPSFWFVGLADWIADGFIPHGQNFVLIALLAASGSVVLGLLGLCVAYPRAIRHAMEESGFSFRRKPRFVISDLWLHPWLSDDQESYALGLYIFKVLLRDARSRAMFLLYAGLAAAYGLRGLAQSIRTPLGEQISEPQVYLLPLPLMLVVFAMFAVRSLCSSPISMESSWIFQLHYWGNVRQVKKALRGVLSAAVIFPAAIACLAFHVWAWNSWLACTHTVFLVVMSMLLMEWILRKIEFVPFTKPRPEHLGRLRVMFGIYVLWFATITFFVAHLENWLLLRPGAFLVFLVVAMGIWLFLHVRNGSRSGPPDIQHQEPAAMFLSLGVDV